MWSATGLLSNIYEASLLEHGNNFFCMMLGALYVDEHWQEWDFVD